MTETEYVKVTICHIREWRDKEISRMRESGLTDLSYRPRSDMSSLGWVLAHQAAVFDFTLNFVIKGLTKGYSKFTKIFENCLPGTSGEWDGTDISKIQEYYDHCEGVFLDWLDTIGQGDFERVIHGGSIPKFFIGKTVRQVITDMFCHLNYHSGHLTAIRKDWIKQRSCQQILHRNNFILDCV